MLIWGSLYLIFSPSRASTRYHLHWKLCRRVFCHIVCLYFWILRKTLSFVKSTPSLFHATAPSHPLTVICRSWAPPPQIPVSELRVNGKLFETPQFKLLSLTRHGSYGPMLTKQSWPIYGCAVDRWFVGVLCLLCPRNYVLPFSFLDWNTILAEKWRRKDNHLSLKMFYYQTKKNICIT